MISGSMAFSTDSMVGTSWGMQRGMTGTGRLPMGSDDPEGCCTLIFISFLFFLAAEGRDGGGGGGGGKKNLKKGTGSGEPVSRGALFTF